MKLRLIITLLLATATVRASTYYVSPTGSDSNAGTSQSSPWKTLAAVDNFAFNAGDNILFQGGASFSGSIYFDNAVSGTSSSGALVSPISLGSYGTGRATINAGTSYGFFAYDNGGFALSNLNFVGSGSTNHSDGLSFFNDLAGDIKQQHVYLDSIAVSGFGKNGIVLGGWKGASGYNDVRITNATTHDNGDSGLATYGPGFNAAAPAYANSNVYVGQVSAFNNRGIAGQTDPTGNGIVLGSVSNATIERSVAHHNGANNTSVTGPAGIWAYDATDVKIQHNESYANKTDYAANGGTGGDGDGFDLDQNVSNSVLQYNYSHGNDGAGFLLYSNQANDAHHGNTVRYNISENDARKNNYSAILAGGVISGDEVYNNTVFLTPSAIGSSAALGVISGTSSLHFRNNLLVATGAAALVDAVGGIDLLFQGNDYWPGNGAFNIRWDGTSYDSLAAWRAATGQERVGGTTVGLNVDPQLVNVGTGGTIANANQLETSTAYRLQSSSPLLDAGLNLSTEFGLNPGSSDFFGTANPQGSGYAVGASEVPEPSVVALEVLGLFAAIFLCRR